MSAQCSNNGIAEKGFCKTQVIIDDLKDSFDLMPLSKKATTGLDVNRVNKEGPTADEVVTYLSSLEGYGGSSVTNDKWDCTEKALWGIIHARHRYPGLAIGMAAGIADGWVKGPHAVIIIWDKGLKSYKYYDPGKPGVVGQLATTELVLSFPMGPADAVDPLSKMQLSKIEEGNCVPMEENYYFYDLQAPDHIYGVLDYLNRPIDPMINDIPCCDSNYHMGAKDKDLLNYWRTLDMAFWTYMHVRQIYRGCAIGVAIGIDPKEMDPKKKQKAYNILWELEAKDKVKRKYWNPHPTKREIVPAERFVPKTVFF
jgi:hypothetical protein